MTSTPTPCNAIEDALRDLDDVTDAMEDVWHERAPALARLVERAEEAHCDELAQRLRWDAMLGYRVDKRSLGPNPLMLNSVAVVRWLTIVVAHL